VKLFAGNHSFVVKAPQEVLRGGESLGLVAAGAASGQIGSEVGAAAHHGDYMVEGPIAGKKRLAAIETAVAVALEDARAELVVAEMIRAGPGARLSGGVAVEEVRKGSQRGIVRRRGPGGAEFGEDFVGEQNRDERAVGAAVHKTNALLAGQDAEIVPGGGGGKAGGAGHAASRNADQAAPDQARAADQMVVQGAFVRGEAEQRDQAVFDVHPKSRGGGTRVHRGGSWDGAVEPKS